MIDDCDVKINNNEFCASVVVAPCSIALQENWLTDSGATAHITMIDIGMTNVCPVSVTVVVSDGSDIKCTKRGDIKLANGERTMTLKDVLYMPKFHKNIVSLGVLIRESFNFSVTGSTMTIKKGHGHISFNRETNGVLYYCKGSRVSYADVVYKHSYSFEWGGQNDKVSGHQRGTRYLRAYCLCTGHSWLYTHMVSNWQ